MVRRQTGRHAAASPSDPSQLLCRDGKHVNAAATRLTPRQLRTMAEWMDSHGVAADLLDEQYLDPAVINEKRTYINDLVTNFVSNLTRDEVAHGRPAAGVQLGRCPRSRRVGGRRPHERPGFWVDVHHPELGRSFKYPGPSGIYNGSPWRISRRAPLIGEHNAEIYCGELGLSAQEVALLTENGAI